ncbi:MAG: hypothetical protein V4487_01800 [Chlamydiota bacterium]
MVRLSGPRRTIFSQKDFEEYPIWTWDDEHEGYLPISEIEPATNDYDILIIKSQFRTNNYTFDGFLIGGRNFHAFGIFVKGKLFCMNLMLHSLIENATKEIFYLLECEPFNFFSVDYYSSIRLKGKKEISGHLNLWKKFE